MIINIHVPLKLDRQIYVILGTNPKLIRINGKLPIDFKKYLVVNGYDYQEYHGYQEFCPRKPNLSSSLPIISA